MRDRNLRRQAESLRRLHPMESLGNAPAKSGDIRAERLEVRLRPKVPFPHKHDFYHLIYLESGAGWHEIDFHRHAAGPGQVFLVLPGQVHAWELSPKTKGYVLEFTRSSLRTGLLGGSYWEALQRLPPCWRAGRESLQLWKILCDESSLPSRAGRADVMEHLLSAMLVQLSRSVDSAVLARPAYSLTEKFRGLVEKHYAQEHAVEYFARLLGLSPKALTTRITRALGKSAGNIVLERCLTEAKRLLAHSDLPVAEIGYQLGFEDPNYFSRFFRGRAGQSPGRFRMLARRSVSL